MIHLFERNEKQHREDKTFVCARVRACVSVRFKPNSDEHRAQFYGI